MMIPSATNATKSVKGVKSDKQSVKSDKLRSISKGIQKRNALRETGEAVGMVAIRVAASLHNRDRKKVR